MGNRIDPGYDLYSNVNCPGVWVPGKTPKKLFLAIAGVEVCDPEDPTTFGPPNGVWVVEHRPDVLPCYYVEQNVPQLIYINFANNRTVIGAESQSFHPALYCDSPGYVWGGMNWFTCPKRKFGNGGAAIYMREPHHLYPSVKSIADKLGIRKARDTFFEPQVVDGSCSVIRFADRRDGTCIKCRIKW